MNKLMISLVEGAQGCVQRLSEHYISLQTNLNDQLLVLGSADVEVSYDSQVVTLPLVVVTGQGSILFGYNR